jgi:hypothetical protein
MAFVQRFLAAGSRLVVRKGKAEAKWHVTKTEIEVEGEPGTANCPLSPAHPPVRTIKHRGFTVYFPPNVVRSRTVLEEGDLVPDVSENIRPVLFTYDIPEDAFVIVRGKKRPFPNPSDELRRYAVRLNYSNWVLNEGDVPHALVARMLDAGCDPLVFEFDPKARQKLISMAVGRLRGEIKLAIARAEESRTRAMGQLDRSGEEEGISPEEAEERFRNRIEAIDERVKQLHADMEAVSARFGINAGILGLCELDATGASIKDEMTKKAEAYAKAIKDLKAAGTSTTNALAKAAEQEAVPTDILADALRDEGRDGEADKLVGAFAGNGDGETFRLPGSEE